MVSVPTVIAEGLDITVLMMNGLNLIFMEKLLGRGRITHQGGRHFCRLEVEEFRNFSGAVNEFYEQNLLLSAIGLQKSYFFILCIM